MKKTGDLISIDGKSFTLGKSLGGGGEGSVFEVEVGRGKCAVKLIDQLKKKPEEVALIKRHIQKLIEVRARSIAHAKTSGSIPLNKILALPQVMLDGDLGYAMAEATECESLTNFLTIPADPVSQEEWSKKYDLSRRYKVITYLFERLEIIHQDGLIFSDLSPNNILVSTGPSNSLVFIDTDNLRTKEDPFTNVLGTPGFIAPEVFNKEEREAEIGLTPIERENAKCFLLSPQSDIYSAAVIAFELLTLNHPYKGIKAMGKDTTPDDELDAEKGKFDYVLKPGTDNYCEGNIFIDKFNDITTSELRELFLRTFIEGKTNVLKRPLAKEFKEAFQKASRLIVTCPNCGEEMMYTIKTDGRGNYSSATRCINPDCKKPIDGQYILSMIADPQNASVDDVVFGPDSTNHFAEPVFLSNIVLNTSKINRIYTADIGISGDLTSDGRFAEIKVDTTNGMADIRIEKPIEGMIPEIVSTEGKRPVPFGQSTIPYSFPFDKDYIRFMKAKTDYGEMTIFGKIRKI